MYHFESKRMGEKERGCILCWDFIGRVGQGPAGGRRGEPLSRAAGAREVVRLIYFPRVSLWAEWVYSPASIMDQINFG